MNNNEMAIKTIASDGFGQIDYIDSYRVMKQTDASIEQIAAQIFALPAWIMTLIRIRDVIVRPFGLKTGKDIGAEAKKTRETFFTKIAQTENELVMGECDRHLDFRVSVLADRASSLVFLTTLVHYNNSGGKFYFFFVKPFHKIIVKSAMRKYAAADKESGK
jgi:hypothetical protein